MKRKKREGEQEMERGGKDKEDKRKEEKKTEGKIDYEKGRCNNRRKGKGRGGSRETMEEERIKNIFEFF